MRSLAMCVREETGAHARHEACTQGGRRERERERERSREVSEVNTSERVCARARALCVCVCVVVWLYHHETSQKGKGTFKAVTRPVSQEGLNHLGNVWVWIQRQS